MATHLQVLLPVVELVLESLANDHLHLRRHCEIASIKQRVEVPAQQQPIVDPMFPALRIGPYVSCLKNR